MAEVTGDLGGQPIQLNNAATEATLKQLLAAMTVIANNTGKDKAAQAKSQKELEAELKRLAAAAKKANKETEKNANNLKDSNEALEENTEVVDKNTKKLEDLGKSLYKGTAALQYLGSQAMSAATGMTHLLSSLSNAGNSLSGAAAVFGQLPVVGGVLGTMFGAVAGAAEKTYEAFKKSASVGANFGGSITEMIDSATGAGLTFDQFSSIIAKSGQDLALLGGSSEAGARRLAALGKEIKGSPIAKELNRLGYSTEAINEGMATYAGQLAKTGSLQGMSDAQLVASTGAYLKDLDALTKLTGKSKKELEDERNARLKDAQFRFIMSKLDVEGQKNLQNLMDTIPKEHQEGMKEIIATGTATSEAGKAALAFLPESSRNMMQLNAQIRTTGKMGAQQTAVIADAYQNEAKRISKTDVAGNMAQFGTDAQKQFYIGLSNAAAREKTYGQIQDEAAKSAEERKKKEGELKDKGLDPASMEAYKNKIAETSNEFTKFLANSGLLDIMMVAFEDLVDIVQNYVVPGFNWLVENFDTVIDVAKGVVIGFLAYKAVMAAAALKTAIMSLGLGVVGKGLVAGATALWGFISPLLAAAAPFLAVGAAVVGAVLAVRALYKAGWDLGTIFEAVGDKLYDIFVLGFKDMMTGILSFLGPRFGGISSDEAKARREAVAAERKDLKQRELARDAARADNRAARGIKEDEVESTTTSTSSTNERSFADRRAARLKQKENEAVEAAAKVKERETQAAKDAEKAAAKTPEVDLSNPQAMYDSMVKRQKGETAGATNQPGTTTTQAVSSPAGNTGAVAPGLPTGPVLSQTELKGQQKEFYDKMYKTLLEQAKKEGVKNPEAIARLGAAQSSIETGYGKSTAGGNNYFGIKDFSGKGGNQQTTQEWDAKQGKMVTIKDSFRKYNSMEESAGDYIKFLKQNSRYKDVLNAGSTEEAIAAQGKTGYATDPNYVNKLAWVQSAANGKQAVNIPGAPRPTTATAQTPPSTVPTTAVAQTATTPPVNTPGLDPNLANNYAWSVFSGKQDPATVPERYRGMVNDILKKPPVHWAQAAGKAPTTAVVVTPPSTVPTTAVAQTAVTPTPTGATTQVAADARANAAAADPRRTDRPQTAVAGARQESPESLLASLNTKMDQLITINRKLSEVNERQLSKLGGIAQRGDLYSTTG